MKPARSHSHLGILLALIAATLAVVGSTAVLPPTAAAQTNDCLANGATLDEARDAYESSCAAPRVDCDPTETGWTCSSGVIGNQAPGGVTPTPQPTVEPDVGPLPVPTTEPDPPSAPSPITEATPSTAPSPNEAPQATIAPETATTPDPTAVPNPGPSAQRPTESQPAATPPIAATECVATGPTLLQAQAAYVAACAALMADCDQLIGTWTCSSGILDDSSPGATATPGTTATPDPTADEPDANVDTGSGTPGPTPPALQGDIVERTYRTTHGPDDNPMKGWSSGWFDDRPESVVGFQYIKWSDFEPSNGEYDFDAIEDIINRSGSTGRHVILRLYCDWWGETETSRGCPDWIYSEIGVDRIEGDNGRYITDYNDPRYVDEAVQAIGALASRYDDDPRLYSFQLGVLGYWGEWHTWGSQVDGSPYEISRRTQERIIDAYVNAFDRVPVMGRQPWGDILAGTSTLGFHNDYFRPNNDHSAEFDSTVAANSLWRHGPIGGEMPPGLDTADYFDLYETPQGRQMIEAGGYSTMKPTSDANQSTDEYMALHRRFGYNYRIENASYSGTTPVGGHTNVVMTVRNIGVAPMYFDWQTQFALLDDNGTPVATSHAAPYDLRSAGPGQAFNLASAVPIDGVAAGEYQLAVRILQPGADRPKSSAWGLRARATYILFANDVPVIDGSWDSSNALSGGWSILGSTAVG